MLLKFHKFILQTKAVGFLNYQSLNKSKYFGTMCEMKNGTVVQA